MSYAHPVPQPRSAPAPAPAHHGTPFLLEVHSQATFETKGFDVYPTTTVGALKVSR